jgi:HrpA-like RNA helicase
MKDYYNTKCIVHIEGRIFPVEEIYLEDVLQTLRWDGRMPPPQGGRRGKARASIRLGVATNVVRAPAKNY